MQAKSHEVKISPSRQIAIVSNMTALALLGNYSLVAIPNVELASVVIFITAYVFNLTMGVWCAILTSIIFASFNPWGPFIPQIWVTQLIGWVYVAIAGGLMNNNSSDIDGKSAGPTEFFVIGAFLAIVFDLVTNIGYSLVFNVPYVLTIMFGLPFMVVHVISNATFMALIIPKIEPILKRDLASMIWNVPNTDLEDCDSGLAVLAHDMEER